MRADFCMAQTDVSVLFATRSRARLLENTLTHLARQDVGSLKWEVVVVDNGSTDETPGVLSRMEDTLPLVKLEQPLPGKNRALNQALAVARGNLLVFTDDDVVAAPNWLREMHAAAARWPKETILGGAITPLLPKNTPAWLRSNQFRFFDMAFSGYWPRCDEGPVECTPIGPNFAVRKEVLRGMHFCETIGPDGTQYAMGSETELLNRLRARGSKCVFLPSAHVYHLVRREQVTRAALLRRAYGLGRGEAILYPSVDCPHLGGVPRYLWRKLVEAGCECVLTACGAPRRRTEAQMTLCRIWGAIREHRQARRFTRTVASS